MNAIIRADNAGLTTREPISGAALYRMSSDAAALCKDIVVATAQTIQGRKYVRVEGWQAIALAHGCAASSGQVTRTDTGYSAIGRVVRIDTGVEIACAEGFVGNDEKMWAARPEYACRAMAQTRAISRACRSAFAHVVVMIGAGLQTTPAEEMADDEPEHPAALNQANRDHRTAQREAAQAAAVNPLPKRQTVGEFLDQLDRELDLAPESSAVHSLMMSDRVTTARGVLTNGAGERLSAWTVRAGQKRAALQAAEQHAAQAAAAGWKDATIAPEQSEQSAKPETIPADPLNATMPENLDDWPLAGEDMAAG